jgi:hypothetical protein
VCHSVFTQCEMECTLQSVNFTFAVGELKKLSFCYLFCNAGLACPSHE